jgi:hypothetical protein
METKKTNQPSKTRVILPLTIGISLVLTVVALRVTFPPRLSLEELQELEIDRRVEADKREVEANQLYVYGKVAKWAKIGCPTCKSRLERSSFVADKVADELSAEGRYGVYYRSYGSYVVNAIKKADTERLFD